MISIWTFNINSIRNKINTINSLLDIGNIDILFISETKIQPKLESELTKKIHLDYNIIWNSNKDAYYHGTCMIFRKETFSKYTLLHTIIPNAKFNHSDEGRLICMEFTTVEDNNIFVIVGTYVPNSGVRTNALSRLDYRVNEWDVDLHAFLNDLKTKYERVIWVGDLNVILSDNDMINPRRRIAGSTKEERLSFSNFMKNSWVDTFDEANKNLIDVSERATYSVYHESEMRLDYIICNEEMRDSLIDCRRHVHIDVSDHIPLEAIFQL